MASLAHWMFSDVVALRYFGFLSCIPLYAIACMSTDNFAPCRLYSAGMLRSMASGNSFSAPSFARQSLSSFPWFPSWPFTHWKVVVADILFRRYAAFLKKSAFLILIQPQSSHSLRNIVRPSIVYFESDIILIGQFVGTTEAVTIIAVISLI
jgi:hypothetical protein